MPNFPMLASPEMPARLELMLYIKFPLHPDFLFTDLASRNETGLGEFVCAILLTRVLLRTHVWTKFTSIICMADFCQM